MVDSYRVIARPGSAEFSEKKSRFVATVERVCDEAAARGVIEDCRSLYRDAGHHCSAFALGPLAEITRTSDDGEPSGTAGMPILETIRGRELSDLVVVVSRWFGGIKLGTGGLARAYSETASLGLDDARRIRRVRVQRARVDVDMARVGRLENDLRSRTDARSIGLKVDEIIYTGQPTIVVSAPKARWEDVDALLAELGLAARPIEQIWADRR